MCKLQYLLFDFLTILFGERAGAFVPGLDLPGDLDRDDLAGAGIATRSSGPTFSWNVCMAHHLAKRLMRLVTADGISRPFTQASSGTP